MEPSTRFHQLLLTLLLLAPLTLPAKTLLHTLDDNQWRQIALPAPPVAGANTLRAIFGDDLDPAAYGRDWVLYAYNAASPGYSRLSLDSVMRRGEAWWMIQKTGKTVTLDYEASPPEPGAPAIVPLTAGAQPTWNMVGYPREDRTPFRQVAVATDSGVCASGCAIAEAAQANVVHDAMWFYGPTGYDTIDVSGVLTGWQGLWTATLGGANGLNPRLTLTRAHVALATDQITVGDRYERAFFSTLSGAAYATASSPVPVGMTINPRTGHLYWTPTPDQAGDWAITVAMTNGAATETTTLNLHVAAGTINTNNVFFLAPNGVNNRGGPASYQQPSQSTRFLCQNADKTPRTFTAKTTIYYRGGVYHNPDYGADKLKRKSITAISCNGKSKTEPLILKPWGNEKPKIKFDSAFGLQIAGDNVTLQGLEIEGMSQEIDYTQAIDAWWTGGTYFNGQGLAVSGRGVTIRDNVIHDTPGAALNSTAKKILDDLTVEDNILFNASWWNTGGTTALGVVGSDNPGAQPSSPTDPTGIRIRNNLVFSSESRIFSHVFSKGFSHLVIDEGSSMLIKQFKGKYRGSYDQGFLVRNNFFLYNGKGVSLRWRDIRLVNNTLYNNGSTITGGGGGLRSNAGQLLTFRKNAVYVDLPGLNAVDFSPEVTLNQCTDNQFYRDLSKEQDCAIGVNNNRRNPDMFANPAIQDFTTADGSGAAMKTFLARKARLDELGYAIQPANYTRTIGGTPYPVNAPEYISAQQQDVVDRVPTPYESTETGDFDGKGDLNDYKITFPDTSNVTGQKVFVLKID